MRQQGIGSRVGGEEVQNSPLQLPIKRTSIASRRAPRVDVLELDQLVERGQGLDPAANTRPLGS